MILMDRNSRCQKFLSDIQDVKYRRETVSASIDVGLAFQINLSRKERGWSQQELASKADVPETTIVDLEDPNSEKHDLAPVLKIAAALDVGLLVRLVPFVSMVEWEADLSTPRLLPRSYAEDVKAVQEEGQSHSGNRTNSPIQVTLISAQDSYGLKEQKQRYENPRRHSLNAC